MEHGHVNLIKVLAMAIAIRKDAVQTSLKKLIANYAEERRAYLKMTCPKPHCGQEYTIYYVPTLDEAEVRSGFEPYLTRDHPNHPVIYEINESPNDPN
jgi:hypothetical protein